MAKEINVEKIITELSKGDANAQYEALGKIKDHVYNVMAVAQKVKEDEASELQSKLERLNGTSEY